MQQSIELNVSLHAAYECLSHLQETYVSWKTWKPRGLSSPLICSGLRELAINSRERHGEIAELVLERYIAWHNTASPGD